MSGRLSFFWFKELHRTSHCQFEQQSPPPFREAHPPQHGPLFKLLLNSQPFSPPELFLCSGSIEVQSSTFYLSQFVQWQCTTYSHEIYVKNNNNLLTLQERALGTFLFKVPGYCNAQPVSKPQSSKHLCGKDLDEALSIQLLKNKSDVLVWHLQLTACF